MDEVFKKFKKDRQELGIKIKDLLRDFIKKYDGLKDIDVEVTRESYALSKANVVSVEIKTEV